MIRKGARSSSTWCRGRSGLFPVGRLDLDSEGLLLCTNDGALTQRLTHPRYEHAKEYLVMMRGQLSPADIQQLAQGMLLEDEATPVMRRRACAKPWRWRGELAPEGYQWVTVVLREGRKRQIRRMFNALGYQVHRLIRVRMGALELGDLEPGQGRWLSPAEASALRRRWACPRKAKKDKGVEHIAIAMDGPAASGKSTVGGALAARLGYLYFDTGVMYRAVTWAALRRGIPIADEAAVTRLAEELLIEVVLPTVADGRQYTVLADGEDVTWEIRRPEVNGSVSPVSAYPGVRAALTRQQRRIGAAGGVMMVGRDIGTVVLPSAELKVYLDATLEERARRRHAENLARGEASDYAQQLADLRRRDLIDSTRAAAPLRAAEDAVRVDSTAMSVDEVVAHVEALACAAIRDRERGERDARA